jgi:hypothetical protein
VTDNGFALKATLKAGSDYSAPWLTVDASDPGDLEFKLNAIASGGAPQALIEAANALKAANNAAPLLKNSEPAQPAPAQNGWSQSPPQQQQQQVHRGGGAPYNPQNQGGGGGAQHPEGWTCGQCNSVLQYKVVTRKSDGKQFKFWACPNQANKDDGHRSEFAN